MLIVAGIIATIIPLIALYIIYTMDLYGTGSFRDIAISFVCGGLAVGLAYLVNQNLYDSGTLTASELIRYGAPIIEEILKALILFYLVRQARFTYFVDGAIYGFAAGMGFAIFENYVYLYNAYDPSLGLAISRVISTNLMHATATGIVGIALGKARFQRSGGKIPFVLGGLLLAMLYHAGFNNLVDREVGGSLLLLYAAIGGFVGVGFIVYTIRRGLVEQKQWIEDQLSQANYAQTKVTGQEARAVGQLADIREILEQTFGSDQADVMEEFLLLQAQLGIQRKALSKLQDEKMQVQVQKRVDDLQVQMEEKRKQIKPYHMVALRTLFPEDSKLFENVMGRIEERAAKPSQSGINIFAGLDTRARANAATIAARESSTDDAAAEEAPVVEEEPPKKISIFQQLESRPKPDEEGE